MRIRRLLRIVPLAVLAGAATAAVAAEAIRLRPMVSIYADAEGTGLRAPEGVGCSGESVAVADSGNGRILIYNAGEDLVRPRAAITASQVRFPIAVGFLPGGEILALDGRTRRIARLSEAGEFRGYLEAEGDDDGPFTPRSFAVAADGRVYVLDVGRGRVLVVAPSGRAERSIAFPGEARFLSDVAVGRRGDVYAIDSVGRRLYAARPGEDALSPITPVLTEDVDFPTSVAVDDEERVYVVDAHGGGVVFFGRDGTFRGRQLAMGWKEGHLRYPADACIDGRGRLFVAERGNSRVQIFSVR